LAVKQGSSGGSGVILGEYIIPSVMRVIVTCPEGAELNRQLSSKLDLTPHQRCLAMLRWAFGVYSQLPGEARQVRSSGGWQQWWTVGAIRAANPGSSGCLDQAPSGT
jgi:hypothetical protein